MVLERVMLLVEDFDILVDFELEFLKIDFGWKYGVDAEAVNEGAELFMAVTPEPGLWKAELFLFFGGRGFTDVS